MSVSRDAVAARRQDLKEKSAATSSLLEYTGSECKYTPNFRLHIILICLEVYSI